jgi:hypothetical protein
MATVSADDGDEGAIAHQQPEPTVPNSDLINLIQAGVVSILALGIGLPLGRALVRRIAGPKVPAQLAPAADPDRLDRMERAIEAIAIEVERIAESQRFMTRLLAEGESERAPALPGPR